MKKIFRALLSAAVLSVALASVASAASTSIGVGMQYLTPITFESNSDLSFKLIKDDSKNGSYTSLGFHSSWDSKKIIPAQLTVHAQPSVQIGFSLPDTITLSDGHSHTADMSYEIFGSNLGQVNAPTVNMVSSGTGVITNAGGAYYLGIVPTQIAFADDVIGMTWTGSLTIGCDYN